MQTSSLRLMALLAGVIFASAARAELVSGGTGHAAALLPDRSILITGGETPDGQLTAGAFLYLSDWLTVEEVAPMNVARWYHSATSLNGNVAIIGGVDASGAVIGSIELFEDGVFVPKSATLATPRYAHAATALGDGRVLVVGGWDADDQPIPESESEIYDPSTNTVVPAVGIRGPWIATEFDDYMPGGEVRVSGGGFLEGEDVDLLFDREPLVGAPKVTTLVAGPGGTFDLVTAYVVQPEDLGTSFILKAVGARSNGSAETWFTDALDGSISIGSITVKNTGTVYVGDEVTLDVVVRNGTQKALSITAFVAAPWESVQSVSQTVDARLNKNTPRTATFTIKGRISQPASGGTVKLSATEGGATCDPASACDASGTFSVAVLARPTTSRYSVIGAADPDGTGAGSVSCNGAVCGSYDEGTRVELGAAANTGSTFTSWKSGPCAGSATNPCVIASLTGDVSVSATFAAIRWTLSVGANTGNGTGTVTCPGGSCPASYAHGTTAVLVATPDPVTSEFAGWTGACQGRESTCSISMTANQDTAPIFALKTHRVTVVQPLAGGEILCDGAVCAATFEVDHGTAIAVTANPDALSGYEFTEWAGACVGSSEVECSWSVTGPITIEGSFSLRQETLSITNPEIGGKLYCGNEVCPAEATHGMTVSVTAVPDTGYELQAWTGDCATEPTTRCDLTMDGAKAASATFQLQERTVEVVQPAKGGSILCGDAACAPTATYSYGDGVTLTAVASAGYEFAGWSKPCDTVEVNVCSFEVTDDEIVQATFRPLPETLTIRVEDDEGNSLEGKATITCNEVTPCSATYDRDTAMKLTAAPSVGYEFKGWSGPCGGSGECIFPMDGAKEVTATFAPMSQTFGISLAGSGSGTFLCDGEPCAETYDYWSSITLQAVPATGSTFTGWSGKDCSGTGDCTVEIRDDTEAVAFFELESYDVAVSAGANGEVECKDGPICPTSALFGARLEITASPELGHVFSKWTGSCADQTTATCTLTVEGPVTAAAEFVPENKVLTVNPSSGGGYVVCSSASGQSACAPSNPYPAGTPLQLEAKKITGYVFVRWTGACEGKPNPCDLTMSTDLTAGAIFDVDPAYLTRKLTVKPSGSGRITATIEGGAATSLDCRTGSTANCSINVPATSPATAVLIKAEAAEGSKFTYWSSPCASTTTDTCRVVMTGTPTVTAYFQPAKFALSARTYASKGTAGGTITGTLGSQNVIACTTGSTTGCSADIPNTAPAPAQKVAFTVTPNATSKFTSWSGACSGIALPSGEAPPCTVTMNMALSVSANFQPATFSLTMQMWGAGKGRVTAAPIVGTDGLSCTTGTGPDCTMAVPNTTPATQVVLTAAPVDAATSRFAGWSAPCAGITDTTCIVPVGAATWVSATFEAIPIAQTP